MAWRPALRLIAVLLLVAACAGPFDPDNIVIRVINQTSATGAFHYEGEGTSGDRSIPPCGYATVAPISSAVPAGNETDFVLGPGPWQITITAAGQTLVASLTAPASGQLYTAYLSAPSGRITLLYRITSQEQEPTRPPGC